MKQILRILVSLTISVFVFGIMFLLGFFTNRYDETIVFSTTLVIAISISVTVGILFYLFLSDFLVNKILRLEKKVEDKLVSMHINELTSLTIGCIVGLIIANLIGLALSGVPVVGNFLVMILNVVFAFLGIRVAQKKKDEFKIFLSKSEKTSKSFGRHKILDTSVIIDGRILDILQTGFIEGKIIIPDFVLEELRHIADSSDALKRNRGRRGLDILNEIQKQIKTPVEIVRWDSKDKDEVDSKLLKMGSKLDAFVVTNDFNLNKVAEFQKVSVLNINELSRAVKTVILPGEQMSILIIKDGKENKQGLAYLDDGTMIVVEGGFKYIGQTKDVIVTSALQTAAGRMIFAKIKDDE